MTNASTDGTMKLCQDCRYFTPDRKFYVLWFQTETSRRFAKCAHPKASDGAVTYAPVTGCSEGHLACANFRCDYSHKDFCGTAGKYFEPYRYVRVENR
jgi:hypothetical protein